MSRKEEQVLSYIRQVARDNVPAGSSVILYGSRARGDAAKDSDWDILIVLDKPSIERSDYDTVSYPFFEGGLSIGELFSPVLYTKEEWRRHSNTLFGYNVNSQGIKVL